MVVDQFFLDMWAAQLLAGQVGPPGTYAPLAGDPTFVGPTLTAGSKVRIDGPRSTVGAPAPALLVTEFINTTDAAAADYSQLRVECAYKATTPSSPFDLAYLGLHSDLQYGTDGVLAIGSAHAVTATVDVKASGHVNNEHAAYFGWMRYSTGAKARAWFSDFSLHGPVAQQPSLLNGLTMFVNNYYNGSPLDTPSAGMWISTLPQGGGGPAAEHLAAMSYAVDVGLGVAGFAGTGGAATTGFTTGIQVGGYGSGWMTSAQRSKIGTGLVLKDIETTAIQIGALQGAAVKGIEFVTGGTLAWLLHASAVTPSTGAIQLPGGNGAPAGQIKWGTDAAAVNLYRSADDTLRTDDNLSVSGAGLFTGAVLIGSTTGDSKFKVINTDGAVVTSKFRNTAGSITTDLVQVLDAAGAVLSRYDKAGYWMTRKSTAPADADLAAGDMALWFDTTNGAAKLMVKAKEAGGTVRTGSLALA